MATVRWGPDALQERSLNILMKVYEPSSSVEARSMQNTVEPALTGFSIRVMGPGGTRMDIRVDGPREWQVVNRMVTKTISTIAGHHTYVVGKTFNLMFSETLEASDVCGTPAWWEELLSHLACLPVVELINPKARKRMTADMCGLNADHVKELRTLCGETIFPYVYIIYLMRHLGPLPDVSTSFSSWEAHDVNLDPQTARESAWQMASFRELQRVLMVMFRVPEYQKPPGGIVTKHWITRFFANVFIGSLFPKWDPSDRDPSTSETAYAATHVQCIVFLMWKILPVDDYTGGWLDGLKSMGVFDASMQGHTYHLEGKGLPEEMIGTLNMKRRTYLRPSLGGFSEAALERRDLASIVVGDTLLRVSDEEHEDARPLRIVSAVKYGNEPTVTTTDEDGCDLVVHGFGPYDATVPFSEGPTGVLEDDLKSMVSWSEVRDACATCVI